ncbi:Bug family tripartite tricarboxylate transporter substrate binding protein [Ramlibacter sp.]|uniref:Bug family tripartite tricarboxylate transporter substrate binding protein n=1 Tax=Ramlibacter sp. TaxID=1917967 RepID=UPI002FCA8435
MIRRRTVLRSLAAGAAAVAAPVLRAQDNAPITILVGAASSMDFTARLIAEHLKEALGRPVVVMSKLGAGGRVALNELKRAAPDGRTLMFSTSSLFAIYPHIYTKLDYDPVADFTPIAGVSLFDLGMATGPMTGATDLKQLVAWTKHQGPSPVYGAAPGAGSSSHFVGIALAQATGLPLKPVHYKDSGVGIIDLAAGRLPMLITGTSPVAAQHKAGKIKLVAVSGEKRSPLAPEVPTFREQGFDVVLENSAALYGPAKLPREIVDRLHAALMPMLSQPAALDKLSGQGMTPQPMNGTQLAAWLAAERKRYEVLAKASGYVPEAL